MFDGLEIKSARPLVLLKRTAQLIVGAYLVIGMIASYRAYYQVRSLYLQSPNSVLRPGAVIKSTVVSYARTQVDVSLELIQGSSSATLSVQHVPDNDWAFFDPRSRQVSQSATITKDVLEKFQPGKAQLRATAIGRPQWTRLPPPVIQEIAVDLQQN